MKTEFEIKKREDVPPLVQAVFDSATKQLGFIPNMYGVIANSEIALPRYVRAEFDRTSLSTKEQEVINLVVSQVNACLYCISFHNSYLLKLGFTEVQLMEIRKGSAGFNPRLNALVTFAKRITEDRGHIQPDDLDIFIAAGYSKASVIDTILLINLRGVTNYVHAALGEFEIDFPLAPPLT